MQKIVIVANGAPYGSESLFNSLRLAIALREQENNLDLRLFLMSDAVTAGSRGQKPGEGYNIQQMLEILTAQNVPVKLCKTCTDGLVSNVGVGQRWARGSWLVGYNTFYDNLLDENLQRAGFGAEAWGEYLRLSANFYQPFAAWHEQTATQEQRMARGYDLTARMRMPFYQHLNTSVSVEQYFGDRVDLFNSGTGYHNPVALSLGLNYTPVPLVTVTAQHKQGESGENQNNLGLNLNYRFGVPLKKQLSAGEVAESQSLRGSRYDNPQRNNLPTLEYRQRKTLTVFLATPPWDLKPGETVPLKLQIRSRYGIRQLIWQGDTQILSLTPGAQANSAEGWTLIMPDWQNGEGASNHWRLSVVVEDNQGQRVSSNEITLTLVEPFDALSNDELRWEP